MFDPAAKVKMFEKNPDQSFNQGEIIFKEGEKGQIMYGIMEGEVEFIVNGQTVELLRKGDVFGVGALVQPDHTRASTAKAKTDCTLAEINRERFLFLVQETPMFALQMLESYSNRCINLKHKLK